MKKQVLVLLTALAVTSGTAIAQSGQDAANACLEAARLIKKDQDFQGALVEAKWCVEGLEQIQQQSILSLFPDSLNGSVGGELDNQTAMGMTMMNRTYSGGGGSVRVALSTGMAGGGFAALAQFGMGLGGSGKKIRVQKRTVLDVSDGVKSNYTVALKSGGILAFTSGELSPRDLLHYVKAFPIADLDDALEG